MLIFLQQLYLSGRLYIYTNLLLYILFKKFLLLIEGKRVILFTINTSKFSMYHFPIKLLTFYNVYTTSNHKQHIFKQFVIDNINTTYKFTHSCKYICKFYARYFQITHTTLIINFPLLTKTTNNYQISDHILMVSPATPLASYMNVPITSRKPASTNSSKTAAP